MPGWCGVRCMHFQHKLHYAQDDYVSFICVDTASMNTSVLQAFISCWLIYIQVHFFFCLSYSNWWCCIVWEQNESNEGACGFLFSFVCMCMCASALSVIFIISRISTTKNTPHHQQPLKENSVHLMFTTKISVVLLN